MSITMPDVRTLDLTRALPGRPGVGKATSVLALSLWLAAGCGHSAPKSKSPAPGAGAQGKTAGIRVVHAERRDIRMTVIQPGTIQAFEVTPIYSRIAGYVDKYRYNIGDRVKVDTRTDTYLERAK